MVRISSLCGLAPSRFCLGTLTFGPLQRNLSNSECERILERAVELGVNFIDTAEIYDNYDKLAPAIAKMPGHFIVATKCYAVTSEEAQASFELACRGLGREYIDIFLLHEQESAHTLAGHSGAAEHFKKLKQQGKIGAFGLSTHFIAGAKAAAEDPEVDVLMPILNINGTGIVDGTAQQMALQVRRTFEGGKFVYLMKILGGGNLISRREEAYKWAMDFPFAHSFAIGCATVDEVNYAAAVIGGADPKTLEDTALSRRKLHVEPWCSRCYKCIARCQQKALYRHGDDVKVDRQKCVMCGYCATVCRDFCLKVY